MARFWRGRGRKGGFVSPQRPAWIRIALGPEYLAHGLGFRAHEDMHHLYYLRLFSLQYVIHDTKAD